MPLSSGLSQRLVLPSVVVRPPNLTGVGKLERRRPLAPNSTLCSGLRKSRAAVLVLDRRAFVMAQVACPWGLDPNAGAEEQEVCW
jgi:hypothetical protein